MDLAKLVERVEGLGGPVTYAHALNIAPIEWFESGNGLLGHFVRALEGSLDAAVSFVEAVLPGARWCVEGAHPIEPDQHPGAHLQGYFGAEGPEGRAWEDVHSTAPTPALALILASLHALHTREGRG